MDLCFNIVFISILSFNTIQFCEEGIFAGVSSGGSIATAIDIAEANDGVTVVAIVCDRGDRYLSTGVYQA